MKLATFILAASLASFGVSVAASAASNPFDKLSGDWTGGGTVKLKDGKLKKVSCKANYKVTGNNLSQDLSCTGDDYEIEAKLKLTDKGGKVKGSWSEVIYDASGEVSGNAKEDIIRAVIRGDKFSGRIESQSHRCGSLDQYPPTRRELRDLSFGHEPLLSPLATPPSLVPRP